LWKEDEAELNGCAVSQTTERWIGNNS